jgi:hypothetical protein
VRNQPTAANESPEVLRAKYGSAVLEGENETEQVALYISAVMTVLCTGSTRASFLHDTANNGGC